VPPVVIELVVILVCPTLGLLFHNLCHQRNVLNAGVAASRKWRLMLPCRPGVWAASYFETKIIDKPTEARILGVSKQT
jgi:hypothetical protein